MNRKKVLLITYYWPPSGGAGVHRWLRFSKYFYENNVDLTVYCPEDAAWPVIDKALEDEVPDSIEVIRREIFEPQKYLSSGSTGVGFTEEKKASLLKKMVIWIRGNMFIPDSRIFWIKPSIKYLDKYLKEHPEITTVISTGPPHSLHLIASKLKRKHNIQWIADFRDPWTQIDFYDKLLPGKRADNKHKKLEKQVLTEADEIITVSDSCALGLNEIVPRTYHVVTNGFEFPEFNENEIQLDKKFTIAHFGSMPEARNPNVLWRALQEVIQENKELKNDLEIRLTGTVDHKVLADAEKYDLIDLVKVEESVSHKESIQLQRSSQILLLVANNTGNVKGILTGKFFEYLGAKRPIIAIGLKDGDLDRAMKSTNAGHFADFNDVSTLKDWITEAYQKFKVGNLSATTKNTDQYNSRNLVQKIVEQLV